MPLRWTMNDVVVGGTLRPPKDLQLEAFGMPRPSYFTLYQVYDSLMRQALRHIGVPERHLESSFSTIDVTGPGGAYYRADRSWRLPAVRGWRKCAAFMFVADNKEEQTSPTLRSSRFGSAQLGGDLNAGLVVPAGPVPIGANGSATLGAEIMFSVDPMVYVEVITGEALADYVIRNLRDDIIGREDPNARDVSGRVEFALDHGLREELIEAYSPPDDWHLRVPITSFNADEAEVLEVKVYLSVPSKGTGYFAVSFVDDYNNDVGETTNALALSVDENLVVTANDPDNIMLPEVAEV